MTTKTFEELMEEIQVRGLFLIGLCQLTEGELMGIWQANVGDRVQNWQFARAESPQDAIAQALALAIGPGIVRKKREVKWAKEEKKGAVLLDMEELGL